MVFKTLAAVIYAIMLIGNQIALLKMGYWEISTLVVPVAILWVLLRYRSKLV
jgi:hypothetical protein